MPIDANIRGLSALAGFGLFVNAIVIAYLNSTTSNFLWSSIYISAMIMVSLAIASKFAIALGVENKLAHAADGVASVVPFISIFFSGIQALNYSNDGLDGFMAGVSIISLVFLVAFGVVDSLVAWFGSKYQVVSEATHTAQERFQAIKEAASGRR
jgi:hypothetical protein